MSVVDNFGKDINVPTKTTVLDAIVFYMRRVNNTISYNKTF